MKQNPVAKSLASGTISVELMVENRQSEGKSKKRFINSNCGGPADVCLGPVQTRERIIFWEHYLKCAAEIIAAIYEEIAGMVPDGAMSTTEILCNPGFNRMYP